MADRYDASQGRCSEKGEVYTRQRLQTGKFMWLRQTPCQFQVTHLEAIQYAPGFSDDGWLVLPFCLGLSGFVTPGNIQFLVLHLLPDFIVPIEGPGDFTCGPCRVVTDALFDESLSPGEDIVFTPAICQTCQDQASQVQLHLRV